MTATVAYCRMSSERAVDVGVMAGGGGASAEPVAVEDGGVALGIDYDDGVSDVDRYRQAAAQHFASHSDDGAGGEAPSGEAYKAQGSVMYSYHAGSELRFGVANAMGKLTGETPV